METQPREEAGLEIAIDEAIAAHAGDARAAIAGLLARCRYLEVARDRAIALGSTGFVRRGAPREQS